MESSAIVTEEDLARQKYFEKDDGIGIAIMVW